MAFKPLPDILASAFCTPAMSFSFAPGPRTLPMSAALALGPRANSFAACSGLIPMPARSLAASFCAIVSTWACISFNLLSSLLHMAT